MAWSRFPEEFKLETLRQVVERGCAVSNVANRAGSIPCLYNVRKWYSPQHNGSLSSRAQWVSVRKIWSKKPIGIESMKIIISWKNRCVHCERTGVKNALSRRYSIKRLCYVMSLSRCGYYVWFVRPPLQHASDDTRLVNLLQKSHEASIRTYGTQESYVICEKNRIAKLARL